MNSERYAEAFFFIVVFFCLDARSALLFILPILMGVLSYLLGKFMQQLKFGKYLDRLSGYLDSLQKN